ncbi:uncharacterized protein [Clytia hemisphaerica]|uniref:uncharacterized protein n=1 Tax=Clytia hemisphaerica TaxID=252671 RepID=UPI0034D73CC8
MSNKRSQLIDSLMAIFLFSNHTSDSDTKPPSKKHSSGLPEIRLQFEDQNNENNNNYNFQEVTEKVEPKDPEFLDMSECILEILLDNILYGYKTLYQRSDYSKLLDRIYDLVSEQRVMKFFLPAFPVKSSNKFQKVLGVDVDFAESIAIDNLIKTARKIEGIYQAGAYIIIMSDYHTFDQYIQVDEENYKIYHEGLKDMIHNKGGDDVIQLISLSYFKQFECVPQRWISQTLAELYGGNVFKASFSEEIKLSPTLMQKYTQQKKFFKQDLCHLLRGLPNSKRKQVLKEVATGMICQGVALDAFLKQQKCIDNYVRLSIHQHHPETGKFAIDLFKNKCRLYGGSAQLRTPWHNTVLFDTQTGEFKIDFKEANREASKVEDSLTSMVYYRSKPYFYVKLYLSRPLKGDYLNLKISMVRNSCGMVIEAYERSKVGPDIFTPETILALTHEFGVVVLRGFNEFEDEQDLLHYYRDHMKQRVLNWSFGPIHKVKPDKDMPGYVNSHDGIPVHWDMVAPPKYMGVDQAIHKYEDFICPVFALYCRSTNRLSDSVGEDDREGATTFIDSIAVVQSLHGCTIEDWKNTKLQYETRLLKTDNQGNEVYFGGKDNSYTYPLIHECPNKDGVDSLRWWQSWSKGEFANAKQHNQFNIQDSPDSMSDVTSQELEEEIRKAAFDERFFFWHQYKQGDLVFVNNETTLHGRNAFGNSDRELWRIQSLPDSQNLPEFFNRQ